MEFSIAVDNCASMRISARANIFCAKMHKAMRMAELQSALRIGARASDQSNSRIWLAATGQSDAIARDFRGHEPGWNRACALLEAVGVTVTISAPGGLSYRVGPPRPHHQSLNDPENGPIHRRVRHLAEILSAICVHFDALESDYAREAFIERSTPQRVRRSRLTNIVAWLGRQVIQGGAAPGSCAAPAGTGEDE